MDYERLAERCLIRATIFESLHEGYAAVHERSCAAAIKELLQRIEELEQRSEDTD